MKKKSPETIKLEHILAAFRKQGNVCPMREPVHGHERAVIGFYCGVMYDSHKGFECAYASDEIGRRGEKVLYECVYKSTRIKV